MATIGKWIVLAMLTLLGSYLFVILPDIPQEAPKARTRPESRTYADFLGTVHVATTDCFGGGFNSSSGNPTITMVVANDDAERSISSLEGVVGFSFPTKNRTLKARAMRMREVDRKTGTWEPTEPIGNIFLNEARVISIADINLLPRQRMQIFVDLETTPDTPVAFGFKVSYN